MSSFFNIRGVIRIHNRLPGVFITEESRLADVFTTRESRLSGDEYTGEATLIGLQKYLLVQNTPDSSDSPLIITWGSLDELVYLKVLFVNMF
jgi:hypothetical protein